MFNIIIIIFVTIILFTLISISKKKFGENKILIVCKILAITFFSLAVIRNFFNDSFIWVINGGVYGETLYKETDIFHSLVRWLSLLSYMIYPVAVYFSVRIYRNITIYFCLPVAILVLINYEKFIMYFTENSGRAIYLPEIYRRIEFSLEVIIMILIPLILRFVLKHKINIRDKFDWWGLSVIPFMLLIVIPVTLPQSLFGFTNNFMKPLSFENLMWVVTALLIFVLLYFLLRFKSRELRYSFLIFLALYLFYHYNSIYLMDLNLSRLPFQLCNLGAYLILISLLVKKKSFFDFILIGNVSGAMIAFAFPDVSEGMLSFWNIHFYIEHTWVFILPLLTVALRIMPRPNRKSSINFTIGFSIYFIFCVIAGVIINSFVYVEGHPVLNKVNYFYIFDDTVANVIPAIKFVWKYPLVISGFTFYPIYILIIYVLFVGFCFVVNWVYIKLLVIADDHFKLRQIRINLFKERGIYKNKFPKENYEDWRCIC